MNTIVKQKVIEQSVTLNKMMSGKLHSAVDPQNGLKQFWETIFQIQTQQKNIRESNFYFKKCISKCGLNWEIRADWESNVKRHLSGLVNSLTLY